MTCDDEARPCAPPQVTIVLPTFNRRERLVRVLTALATQQGDVEFEVVVVSDGSTDGTNDYLTSPEPPMPIVAVLQDNAGPAAARNAGWRAARGALVLFLDDDVVPEPNLVLAHVGAHEHLGETAVVIGPMLTPPDVTLSPWVAWEQAMLDKQYELLRGQASASYRNFYTGNASLRRAQLSAVGGFDTSFRRAEDIELAYRLATRGATFAYRDQARGLHYAERSFESWQRTAYDYGRNDVAFVRAGQSDVLPQIAVNFAGRHWLQRVTVRAVVPRKRCAAATRLLLRLVIDVTERLRLASLLRQALSGLYGLLYHEGVLDELGSVEQFRAVVDGKSAQVV